jgi:hypothetical protein
MTADTYGRAPAATKPMAARLAPDDATLSLPEESLTVGKRMVNRGNTRIRR